MKTISMLVLLLCVACVTVTTPDGGTALVPGMSSQVADVVQSMLPWWAKAVIGVASTAAVSATSAAASKNGRAAWSVVGDPQNGVLESLHALGHVTTFGLVPPPASVPVAAKES